MLILRLSNKQLEYGFDYLYDMINKCKSYDEFHLCDGYRSIFDSQCKALKRYDLIKRVNNLSLSTINMIAKKEMDKLNELLSKRRAN